MQEIRILCCNAVIMAGASIQLNHTMQHISETFQLIQTKLDAQSTYRCPSYKMDIFL